MCTPDFVAVGGAPSAASQSLLLQRDLDCATLARALLERLSHPAEAAAIPLTSDGATDSEMDIVWLEAFLFAGRDGDFLCDVPEAEAPARQGFRQSLESFWSLDGAAVRTEGEPIRLVATAALPTAGSPARKAWGSDT